MSTTAPMRKDPKAGDGHFRFTGWHMLGVMVLFFGTIISVNVVMAWNAVSSWSGLVVQNTYVASQEFNGKLEKARAFAASGLSGTLLIAGDRVSYRLQDAGGAAVAADAVTITFKRPTDERDDFRLTLVADGAGNYAAVHAIPAGQWIADIASVRDGQAIFHQTIRTVVQGGRP